MICYVRRGGMRPPQLHEALELGFDGHFKLWRSVSRATDPPTPIGRFGGNLASADAALLEEVARRALAEGSRTWPVTPDSPVDVLEVDDASATLGMRHAGDGAWGELVALVRPLLVRLTSAPVAAVGLVVDDGAALVHLGPERLKLDLSTLAVRVTHWRASSSLGQWTAPATSHGEVVAGPNWRLALPFDHGFALQAGDRLDVQVIFVADDGAQMRGVSLQTP